MPQEKDVRIKHEQGPLLPMVRVHAGVHGARSPGVTAMVGVGKSEFQINLYQFVPTSYEFGTNWYEFMSMASLHACRVLPLFVLGAIWLWWVLLGRDFHWMMRNESRA